MLNKSPTEVYGLDFSPVKKSQGEKEFEFKVRNTLIKN
jgi:hypothetical protein